MPKSAVKKVVERHDRKSPFLSIALISDMVRTFNVSTAAACRRLKELKYLVADNINEGEFNYCTERLIK